MQAEPLARRAKVGDRSERVRADEHTLLGPPERDFLPDALARDREELERRAVDLPGRNEMMRNPEPGGDCAAVTVVAVEELEHPVGLPQPARPLLRLEPGEGIDQPHAAVGYERVRRAGHRLAVVLPAVPEFQLVAEAHRD